MTAVDTVVYGARELVVGPSANDSLVKYEDGAVAIADGEVVAVGPTEAVTREYPPENAATELNATGQAVVPGFVDPHTHALFAGDRADEFGARLRGRTYQEILADGGGILRTVRAVRTADDETLRARLRAHLDTALSYGATTVEVKSGYGLDRETECRMLAVIDGVASEHPVDVVATFMGAHAVPEDTERAEYVNRVVDEQLPAVADQGIAEFCDVFCEEGVFTVADARRILEAGTRHGLTPKIHAEEFTRLGGAQLAAEVGAVSADHLLHATPNDATALTDAGVVPVFLPAAAFSLREAYADPTPFQEVDAPIALGTDFNPNCHSTSVPMTVALACLGMGLTPEQALTGVTRNAALALGRDDGTGTLEPGAPGDLVVLDAPSHLHLPYRFGEQQIKTVVKGGEVVATPDSGVIR